jgi:hypothetical protein
MKVSRESLFCHASKLPTLSCIHRHGVEVFGRRRGCATKSYDRPVSGAGEPHPGVRGAGEIVADYGHVHRIHDPRARVKSKITPLRAGG